MRIRFEPGAGMRLAQPKTMRAPPPGLKQMLANLAILLASALLVAYGAIMAWAWLAADSLIFPYTGTDEPPPPGVRTIPSGDGTPIAVLHLKAGPDAPLLLHSHGNFEDLGDILPRLENFRRRGVSVLAYDYPGYGASGGKPGEAAVYAAVEAVYAHAADTLGYAPEAIVAHGRSLGGGPACHLAARKPVGGLILEAAFTSAFRVMTRYPVLPWDKFPNLRNLRRVKRPVLLVHGTEDEVIPFHHALRNRRALRHTRCETLWIEGAGHNDFVAEAGETYWDTVLPFIRESTQ